MFSDLILFAVLGGMVCLLVYVGSIVVAFYKQDRISRSDPLSEGKETSYVFPVSYDEAESYENQKSDFLKQALNKDSLPPAQFAQFVKTAPDSDRVSFIKCPISFLEKAESTTSQAVDGCH